MADLDDLREGNNFAIGVTSGEQRFHVKGAANLPWGMKDRYPVFSILQPVKQ